MTDQVLKPTPEQIDRERAGLAKLGLGIDANGVVYVLRRDFIVRVRPAFDVRIEGVQDEEAARALALDYVLDREPMGQSLLGVLREASDPTSFYLSDAEVAVEVLSDDVPDDGYLTPLEARGPDDPRDAR